ncbi:MAG: hypothetical protein DRP09_10485 [Candidatus Thorarchaeota archaeon]|nr:MAG: hypothetical protein DRP09_10485 [Candidatus Thorarchaeota archaeon]
MTGDSEIYIKLARDLSAAMAAVKLEIPPNILGNYREMQLTREDYRQMGTSLFIERNYMRREEMQNKNQNGNGAAAAGPSTEKQQGFIAKLIREKEGAEDVIASFLDANGKTSTMDLDSSQASALIDTLIGLKKRRE